MRLHCFFAVNSSINAAGDHLAGGSFTEKELNERLFPKLRTQSLWCSGEVYSRRVDGAGFESYRTLFFLLSFSSVFCVVVFYKYIAK